MNEGGNWRELRYRHKEFSREIHGGIQKAFSVVYDDNKASRENEREFLGLQNIFRTSKHCASLQMFCVVFFFFRFATIGIVHTKQILLIMDGEKFPSQLPFETITIKRQR
jgi:hypothetical protein